MATIILEGPDSSGKTTLAYALLGWMGPRLGQYVKSPAGRQTDWKGEWNDWNRNQLRESNVPKLKGYNIEVESTIRVLDRTPEISELVYGLAVRGITRLYDPMSSLMGLNHHDTILIMTSTDKPYYGGHIDPSGTPVYGYRKAIANHYDMITTLMRLHTTIVTTWDYDTSEFNWVCNFIASRFMMKGLDPVPSLKFREYVDKGKEIVNGS